ncbi:hypothetical protein BVG19_g5070 [[Candida] boidinii]|nr:hypothetical protein BVG19_g5070 [[Candida] boidinii]OWB53647.1 hypothetical protein B5S27_g5253 [[Candida] boidinii]OWB85575.1 hypothetical protein B5S33_g4244 [[Candida] boidinii]
MSLPACHNDFVSDTCTVPTESMIKSVALASVGDDVYDTDTDTNDLEAKVSAMTGHEAGLYCVSGTLSNQIALRSHLKQPPHSVLCDCRSHIITSEAGGLATLSQAMYSAVIPSNGIHLTLQDIIDNYIPDDDNIHCAPTKVVSLENTLHGLIFPIDEIAKISKWCHENNIILHLDGARIWNASAATGISLKEYGQYFDSISLCLSKSLGAPIGSILVGKKDFLKKANHFKKQNGGGIRQCGMLTRMATIAIDENFSKLPLVDRMTKEFSDYLESELGYVLFCPTQTNFVFLDLTKSKVDPAKIHEIGLKNKINVYGGRIAFHYQISEESLVNLRKTFKEAMDYSKEHPYNGKFSIYG